MPKNGCFNVSLGTDSHEISKNSFELVIYFATASHEISKNGVS